MKKLLSIVAAAAMAFSLAACGMDSGTASEGSTAAEGSASQAEVGETVAPTGQRMTMGTGGTSGTYYAFGGVLGQYIKNKAGIDITVVATDGSKSNIQGIDAGDYQLGTVQSDVIAYAWDGTKAFENDGPVQNFRIIGGLYAETVQLVTLNPDIKTAADLKGKSVSIGAPGSGVYFNAIDVLNAAGLTEDDIKPQYLSFADSAEGLKDGKIDAAFIVAGAPTPAITEIATSNDVTLVPIDGEMADTILADCPYYTTLTIPAGTYPGQDEDVETITIKATLIVSADADEDTVYNITKAIYDNADSIAAEHSKGAELTIENATSGMTAPFHSGAAKYFEEQGVTVETE